MRHRLIWKILAGFAFTTFIVIQLVWAASYLLWSDSSRVRAAAETVAPIHLSAATLALESGGFARYTDVSRQWPVSERSRVKVSRESDSSAVGISTDVVSAQAVDPQGGVWNVYYQLPSKKVSWRYFVQLPSPNWALPAMLGGLVFSAALAWYLIRPVRALRQAFRDLSEGRLDTRLRPLMGRRRDEIADLATDFDRMAERLQDLVLMRDQLLHDVSHELRSPLARISLAVALLRQRGDVPQNSLERIEYEVQKLDQLVGELLSLSRHESGMAEMDAYFDLLALLDALVADTSFEAQVKNVQISLMVESPSRNFLLQGSADLIRRAFENVLRNAVRFSPPGQVVEVRLSTGFPALQSVLVAIGDHGPGIPEDQLERVFDPFFRVPENGFPQGYGLGLSIARRAIEGHGGSISLENRPNGGLLVSISLSVASIDPAFIDSTP